MFYKNTGFNIYTNEGTSSDDEVNEMQLPDYARGESFFDEGYVDERGVFVETGEIHGPGRQYIPYGKDDRLQKKSIEGKLVSSSCGESPFMSIRQQKAACETTMRRAAHCVKQGPPEKGRKVESGVPYKGLRCADPIDCGFGRIAPPEPHPRVPFKIKHVDGDRNGIRPCRKDQEDRRGMRRPMEEKYRTVCNDFPTKPHRMMHARLGEKTFTDTSLERMQNMKALRVGCADRVCRPRMGGDWDGDED